MQSRVCEVQAHVQAHGMTSIKHMCLHVFDRVNLVNMSCACIELPSLHAVKLHCGVGDE